MKPILFADCIFSLGQGVPYRIRANGGQPVEYRARISHGTRPNTRRLNWSIQVIGELLSFLAELLRMGLLRLGNPTESCDLLGQNRYTPTWTKGNGHGEQFAVVLLFLSSRWLLLRQLTMGLEYGWPF
jgi:hypothetical protein